VHQEADQTEEVSVEKHSEEAVAEKGNQ